LPVLVQSVLLKEQLVVIGSAVFDAAGSLDE
jgi:hypothetical protein